MLIAKQICAKGAESRKKDHNATSTCRTGPPPLARNGRNRGNRGCSIILYFVKCAGHLAHASVGVLLIFNAQQAATWGFIKPLLHCRNPATYPCQLLRLTAVSWGTWCVSLCRFGFECACHGRCPDITPNFSALHAEEQTTEQPKLSVGVP